MKRLWIALVSVFILVGGLVLAACGGKKITLTLSEYSPAEICIVDGKADPYVVQAEVSGIKNGRVSVTSSDKHVVVAKASYIPNSSKSSIVISVPTDNGNLIGHEGTAQVTITSVDDASARQTIDVKVYSDIQGMEKKTTGFEPEKDPRFAVRGESVTLNYADLVTFTDGTRDGARKDITWSFSESLSETAGDFTVDGATITGNSLSLSPDFEGETVTIYAHATHNPNAKVAEVELTVLDKLDPSSIEMQISYSSSGAWEDYQEQNQDGQMTKNPLHIIPNYDSENNVAGNAEQYQGYIKLLFSAKEELNVSPIVNGATLIGHQGQVYQIIEVEKNGERKYNEEKDKYEYVFKVHAIERYKNAEGNNVDNPSVNGDSEVKFKIKYSNFDYSNFDYCVTTDTIKVECYEAINNLNVLDEEGHDVTVSANGQVQNIYTQYQNGIGKPFTVELLPKTAIANKQFAIQITYQDGTQLNTDESGAQLSYLQFYYKRGGKTERVELVNVGDQNFRSKENAIPADVKEIYAKAEGVTNQIPNVAVTFSYVTNPDGVNEVVLMSLNQSASALEVVAPSGETTEIVAPTSSDSSLEIEKRLILRRQKNIVGLSVVSGGNGFSVESTPYNAVAEDNQVTFTIKLKIDAFGITENGWYQIVHENGFVSEKFSVKLFLPLEDARIEYEGGGSNTGVTYYDESDELYVLRNGKFELEPDASTSVSRLQLKYASSIALPTYTNRFDPQHYANASVVFRFLDDATWQTLGQEGDFESLSIDQIYAHATGSSAFIAIDGREGSIITTFDSAGKTWVLALFTGLDQKGQEFTLARLIFVETHIALSELSTQTLSYTIYAKDSVGDDVDGQNLTQREVTISFGENLPEEVTYKNFALFTFSSMSMGSKIKNDSQNIIWAENYYSVSDVVIEGTWMSFSINGNTTHGSPMIADELTISYRYQNIYRAITLKINIINADRVEKVEWLNESDGGLYFEVDQSQDEQVIVTSVAPDKAMNKEISYFVFDSQGNYLTDQTLLSIRNVDGQGIVKANGVAGAGYIIVIPADAHRNGQISYTDQNNAAKSVSVSELGLQFDNLVKNAYFKTNALSDQQISFSEILIKVPFTIADGRSWSTAYRLYDQTDFENLSSNGFYYVMNSVTLPNWGQGVTQFGQNNDLFGGIAGFRDGISITLNGGQSFVNTLGSGTPSPDPDHEVKIANLTFSGSVSGDGFVANVNKGKIENVVVDVKISDDGFASSSVVASDEYAGTLVGQNFGTLSHLKALGVSVSSAQYVGGLAGYNEGIIEYCQFEIYNFAADQAEDSAKANMLSGAYVGGLVGYAKGGEISYSFAYDYTLVENSKGKNLLGDNVGAFVGFVAEKTTAQVVFAVVNAVKDNFEQLQGGAAEGVTFTPTDYYAGYYVDKQYTVSSSAITDRSVWLTQGQSGWQEWVNGGQSHLVIYQDKPLSETEVRSASIKTSMLDERYYQSVNVDKTNAVLFYYQTDEVDQAELSSSEQSALLRLNTISLSVFDPDGATISDRIVVLSSNSNIVEVTNSALVVKGAGDVTLTVASRQDYRLQTKIKVTIVNALSRLTAAWTSYAGQSTLENGTRINVQRQTSFTVVYTFENERVYLGTQGRNFALTQSDVTMATAVEPVNPEGPKQAPAVSLDANILSFASTANTQDESQITTTVSLDGATKNINTKIGEIFSHTFAVGLFDGAINLSLSPAVLSITPNTTGVVEVELQTNDEEDNISVALQLVSGEQRFDLTAKDGTYSYGGQDRFVVVIEDKGTDDAEAGQPIVKHYTVKISVADTYKSKISGAEVYKVTINSSSNIRSQELTLNVDRQEFTNLDITTYQTRGQYDIGVSSGLYYQKGDRTSVLRPGDTALVEVTVNPNFAYYDYFTMTVEGSPNINAVTLAYMKQLPNAVKGTAAFVEGEYNSYAGGIIVTDGGNVGKGKLVFKIWLNPNVAQEARLVLRIDFYMNGVEEPIEYAIHPLTVTYLAEPVIKFDGGEVGPFLLARGSSVDVAVEVDFNQALDPITSTLSGFESGISISPWREGTVSSNGRKIYTATLTARVDASVENDDGLSQFELNVKIQRTVNGIVTSNDKTIYIRLVNFVVSGTGDKVDMYLDFQEGNNYVARIGVEETLPLRYVLEPEKYNYDETDATEKKIVDTFNRAKTLFNQTGYYNDYDDNIKPDYTQDSEKYDYQQECEQYTINYNYKNNQLVQIPIKERLFYWSDATNGWTNVWNAEANQWRSAGGFFEFSGDQGTVVVKGVNKTSAPVRFKVITYIQVGSGSSSVATKEYEFTMESRETSNEDLPLVVWNAEQFAALSEGDINDPQDYILMDDIVLDDWTPFSTDAIRSLDGNGHVIYLNGFDYNPDTAPNLRLALFDEVTEGTTLKNIKVNLYNGGQIIADISKYTNIEIAGFALTNNGIITNCEVVSYYLYGSNSSVIRTPSGLNVAYVNGAGNTSETIMNGSSAWQSSVAGFVLQNNANITNSRVGGTTMTRLTEQTSSPDIMASVEQSLDVFNIIAQGDMAGFVLNNAGAISSSFAARIGMNNKSNYADRYVAGFVGNNYGSIYTSYIEGDGVDAADKFCKVGTTITATLSKIAGFVYGNDGHIRDSYSNILISNSKSEEAIYYASGFVYSNEKNGLIENCYSASQVASSRYSQMNFTGTSANGTPNNVGSRYVNDYFYSSDSYATGQLSTEEHLDTGAIRLEIVDDEDFFYGFSFASDLTSNDGVWKMSKDFGPQLVEPNIIAITHRRYVQLDEVAENGKDYLLPYSKIDTVENGIIDTTYGSRFNPIIIRTPQEFNAVFGASDSFDVQGKYDDFSVNGNYRLVDNVDLSLLVTSGEANFELSSSSRAFTGSLMGNGFTISNLSISANQGLDTREFSFGMFSSIEGGILLNFGLTVRRVNNTRASLVGALAGIVRDAKIVNITIDFEEGGSIEGGNFVGSVAGMVMGNSQIRNISVTDANIVTRRFDNSTSEVEHVFSTDSANEWRIQLDQVVGKNLVSKVDPNYLATLITYLNTRSYSYAGGLIGYADIYTNNTPLTSYRHTELRSLKDYPLTTLRASGDINVRAQVAGGLIGFQGLTSYIMDAGLTINGGQNANSHIVATKYYAGGVVGQATSTLSQLFAEYDATTQRTIESNIGAYYNNGSTEVERGTLDIFDTGIENEKYSDIIAVGGLVGLANAGAMTISYSKLNVISMNANYAGGVIGRIATSAQATYSFSDGSNDFQTNYILNEVYATGDVRARRRTVASGEILGSSGGIVGQIAQGSRAAMLSVNAMNMFSIYDYENKAPYTLTQLSGSDGASLKNVGVYALVGAGTEEDKNVLTFVKKMIEDIDSTSTDSATRQSITSVGYVSIYSPCADLTAALTVSPAPNVAPPTSDDLTDEKVVLFEITNYNSLTSIEVGQDITRGYFTSGSGTWNVENWSHMSNELYPSIRYYMTTTTYVWLDNTLASVRKVVEEVEANPHIEIRVRGKNADDKTYSDIDFTALFDALSNGEEIMLQNAPYQGRLIFKQEYVEGLNQGNNITLTNTPSIILNRPMFAETSEGFSFDNVTFILKENSSIQADKSLYRSLAYSGAIVNGNASNGNITNVTVLVDNQVNLKAQNGAAGILSRSMQSVSIDRLQINSQIQAGVGVGTQSVVNVGVDTGSLDNGGLHVGLVTGQYYQDSKEFNRRISGIEVACYNTSPNLISFNGGTVTSLYVGGLFGSVNKNQETEPESGTKLLNFDLGSISSEANGSPVITVSSGVKFENLYAGGSVGYLGGQNLATSLGTVRDFNVNLNVDGEQSSDSEEGKPGANIGLLIGELQTSVPVSIEASGASGDSFGGEIQVRSSIMLHNANIGGVVGNIAAVQGADDSTAAPKLTLSNVRANVKIHSGDASFVDQMAENAVNQIDTKGGGDIPYIYLAGNSNVGGMVGKSEGELLIMGGTEVNNPASVNNNSFNPIAISVVTTDKIKNSNANIGGVVGQAAGATTINGYVAVQSLFAITSQKLDDKDETTTKFAITSQKLDDKDETTTNYGGFIGKALGDVKITSGSENYITKLVRSQVLTSASSAVAGGIIGVIGDEKTTPTATISGTAFGGAVKSYVGNTDMTVGGTIGSIQNASTITLENNVNYGDFFNIDANLDDFTFAGLIAAASNAERTVTAQNNFSLMTNHNDRDVKNDTEGNIFALFGNNIQKNQEDSLKENYYNHALSMATDDIGTEIGYASQYKEYQGYSAKKDTGHQMTSSGVSGTIGWGDLNTGNEDINLTFLGNDATTSGTKFQPILIKDAKPNAITYDKFNGGTTMATNCVTYYALDGDVTLEKNTDTLFASDAQFTPSNTRALGGQYDYGGDHGQSNLYIGLIGDSNTLTRKVNITDDTNGAYDALPPLFQRMSKNSFISGLHIELDIESENAKSTIGGEGVFGGVVNEMKGGKIYSVGVSGQISLGGEKAMTLGGFAGNMSGGHFDKSNISVDIVYRGPSGKASTLGALAGSLAQGESQSIWFANSYTAGSIYTYTDANVYAVAPASSGTFENSYTITHTEVTDVTIEASEVKEPVRKVFEKSTTSSENKNSAAFLENFAYTQKALEIAQEITGVKDYSALTPGTSVNSWKAYYDYNFGYPTFANHYANPTSYYTRGDVIETADRNNNASVDNDEIARYQYLPVRAADFNKDLTTGDNSKDYFFGIPNFEVLEKLSGYESAVKTNGEYDKSSKLSDKEPKDGIYFEDKKLNRSVLLNNLDMKLAYITKTQETNTFDSVEIDITDRLFDGNGMSIKNLTGSLFNDVTSSGDGTISTIENLNLIDADMTNTGALANSVTDATINYVSAQGTTKVSGSGNVGGLVNEMTGGSILNSTNLMIISSSPTTAAKIGGLVGAAGTYQKDEKTTETTIGYSNNSATIIVNGAAKVGGLLGSGAANISNSYNAAGLAANYNTTFEDSTYYLGGLVGQLTGGSVDRSYNTGLIRGGTKESTGMAYIAGLVGQLGSTESPTEAKISNCVNEASVEGRSESTWSFTDNGANIQMKQGTKHLNVYGLAYATGAGEISNSYMTDDVQVTPNGNALPNNAVLVQWNKEDEEGAFDTQGAKTENGNTYHTYGMGFKKNVYADETKTLFEKHEMRFIQEEIVGWTLSSTFIKPGGIFDEQPSVDGGINHETDELKNSWSIDKYNFSDGMLLEASDDLVHQPTPYSEVNITSYDEYGFPKSIRFPYHIYQGFSYDLWTGYWTGVNWDLTPRFDWNNTEHPSYYNFSTGFYYWSADWPLGADGRYTNDSTLQTSFIDTDNYDNAQFKSDSEHNTQVFAYTGTDTVHERLISMTPGYWLLSTNVSNIQSNQDVFKNGINQLRQDLNLSTTGSGESDILVAGNPYYLTNKGSVDALIKLQSDAYTYTTTYVDKDNQIPQGIPIREITASNTSDLPIGDIKVTERIGNTLTLKIYASREIETSEWSDFTFTISYSHEESHEISFSNANYIFSPTDDIIQIVLDEDDKVALDEILIENDASIHTASRENSDESVSGKVFKAKRADRSDYIWLVYDNGSIYYYQNLVVDGDQTNTGKLMPGYFVDANFDYYTTDFEYVEVTDPEVISNNLDNTNTHKERTITGTYPAESISKDIEVTENFGTMNTLAESDLKVTKTEDGIQFAVDLPTSGTKAVVALQNTSRPTHIAKFDGIEWTATAGEVFADGKSMHIAVQDNHLTLTINEVMEDYSRIQAIVEEYVIINQTAEDVVEETINFDGAYKRDSEQKIEQDNYYQFSYTLDYAYSVSDGEYYDAEINEDGNISLAIKPTNVIDFGDIKVAYGDTEIKSLHITERITSSSYSAQFRNEGALGVWLQGEINVDGETLKVDQYLEAGSTFNDASLSSENGFAKATISYDIINKNVSVKPQENSETEQNEYELQFSQNGKTYTISFVPGDSPTMYGSVTHVEGEETVTDYTFSRDEQGNIEWRSGGSMLVYNATEQRYLQYYKMQYIPDLSQFIVEETDEESDTAYYSLSFDQDIQIVKLADILSGAVDDKIDLNRQNYGILTNLNESENVYYDDNGQMKQTTLESARKQTVSNDETTYTFYYGENAKKPFAIKISTSAQDNYEQYILLDFCLIVYDEYYTYADNYDNADAYRQLFEFGSSNYAKTIFDSSQNPYSTQELLHAAELRWAKDDSGQYTFYFKDDVTLESVYKLTFTSDSSHSMTMPSAVKPSATFEVEVSEGTITVPEELNDAKEFNGNELTFKYKVDGTNSITAVLNLQGTIEDCKYASEPSSENTEHYNYAGIILTQNIDFGYLTENIMTLSTNIIGNGHYLKYVCDDPMQTALIGQFGDSSNNVFMRDLSVIGLRHNFEEKSYLLGLIKIRTYGSGASAILVNENNATISNVTVYGSITNVGSQNEDGNVGVVLTNKNVATISNVNSNVSLNSINASSSSSPDNVAVISGFARTNVGTMTGVEYSGLIVAGNGYSAKDGAPGLSGMENFDIDMKVIYQTKKLSKKSAKSLYFDKNGENKSITTSDVDNTNDPDAKSSKDDSGNKVWIYRNKLNTPVTIIANGKDGQEAEKVGKGGNVYAFAVQNSGSVNGVSKVSGIARAGDGGNKGRGGNGGAGADLYQFGQHQFYPNQDKIESNAAAYKASGFVTDEGFYESDSKAGPFLSNVIEQNLREYSLNYKPDENLNRARNTFRLESPLLHYISLMYKLNDDQGLMWNFKGERFASNVEQSKIGTFNNEEFEYPQKQMHYTDIGVVASLPGNDTGHKLLINNWGGDGAHASQGDNSGGMARLYLYNTEKTSDHCIDGYPGETAYHGDGGRGGLGGIYLDQNVNYAGHGDIVQVYKNGIDGHEAILSGWKLETSSQVSVLSQTNRLQTNLGYKTEQEDTFLKQHFYEYYRLDDSGIRGKILDDKGNRIKSQ